MKIISKEEAVTLYNDGKEVFLLYEDNSESAVDNLERILSHEGMFGVEKVTPLIDSM